MTSSTSLSFFIGKRYTFSQREQRFISFVSLVSLLGIILGVMAMIIVLSVMNGFDRELKQRILRVIPHGFVAAEAIDDREDFIRQLESQPGVVATSPYVEEMVVMLYGERSAPVNLNGILPATETGVSDIHESLVYGTLDGLEQERFGIILGRGLARQLGAGVGDKVNIMLPDISVSPVGVHIRQKRFVVTGIFHVGADVDNHLALIHLDRALKLFRRNGAIQQLRVKTIDLHSAPQTLQQLQQQHPGLKVHSWQDTHRDLFEAIAMEKRMVSLLLYVVIAVAVFNIVSILTMMVANKRKDIAILKVMGASSAMIMRVFMMQGLLVGLTGILIGTLLGVLFATTTPDLVDWIEGVFGGQVFGSSIYYLAHLPSLLIWRDVVMIALVSLLLTLLATLYPAWKSARIDPVVSINN